MAAGSVSSWRLAQWKGTKPYNVLLITNSTRLLAREYHWVCRLDTLCTNERVCFVTDVSCAPTNTAKPACIIWGERCRDHLTVGTRRAEQGTHWRLSSLFPRECSWQLRRNNTQFRSCSASARRVTPQILASLCCLRTGAMSLLSLHKGVPETCTGKLWPSHLQLRQAGAAGAHQPPDLPWQAAQQQARKAIAQPADGTR